MNIRVNIHFLPEEAEPRSGILPTGRGDFPGSFPESDSCGAGKNMLPCRKDK